MSRVEPPLLLLATLVTAVLVFGEVVSPVRSITALCWIAICPGAAVCRMLGLRARAQVLLAVPTSLALSAVVSGVLIYFGAYVWQLGFVILIALVVGAVTLSLAPIRFSTRIPASRTTLTGKLADEQRQAALLEALQAGASLDEAAVAAGLTARTLRKRMHTSEALRRAIELSQGGRLVGAGERADRQG